ncbi:4-sulfomuconolactone hydrolase [Seiridium cupressi]
MAYITSIHFFLGIFLSLAHAQNLTLAPPSTWDTHIHIFDQARFPLAADALYIPGNYTVDDLRRFDGSMGLGHTVIVQPSVYDYDNACLLDALTQLGTDYARGVVVFDPANTTSDTLRQWHSLGVRAARFNIVTTNTTLTKEQLNTTLTAYAQSFRAASLDWAVQVAVQGNVIDMLEYIVPELGLKVVFDHMGYPGVSDNVTTITDPYQLQGFNTLVKLIRQGNTFVKLSAPYRSTDDWRSLDPVVKELLTVGESRVVFGTDWPHPGFEGLDIRPWIEQVEELCDGDKDLIQSVFLENSKVLFDVKSCS